MATYNDKEKKFKNKAGATFGYLTAYRKDLHMERPHMKQWSSSVFPVNTNPISSPWVVCISI